MSCVDEIISIPKQPSSGKFKSHSRLEVGHEHTIPICIEEATSCTQAEATALSCRKPHGNIIDELLLFFNVSPGQALLTALYCIVTSKPELSVLYIR